MFSRTNSLLAAFSSAVALAFFLASASTVIAQPSGGVAAQPLALAAVAPVANCAALTGADISAAVGAPTHITAAAVVPGSGAAPYCKVTGYVEPAIKFEVRLPTATWTQRLVQTGCGGTCGMLNIHLGNDQGCKVAENGELALTSTDMGHSGGMDGSFGAKDYQLRIDFAYRGVHLTTLAAKALLVKFYGQAPKFSYFAGCSDGGREALMEAQRFPEDFDGVTAGAPAMNFTTQNTFYHGWNVRANLGADGKPVLAADKLPILHKAVVAQCDALDGLKDGLVANPLACHPDLSVVQCKPGQNPQECLTAEQAHVAMELYAGAHDTAGGKLVLSGPMPGSELAWAGVFIPMPGQDRVMSGMISTGALQNLVYDPNPAAGYALAKLNFDRATFDATTRLHKLYDATDPDLSPFAARGGKLILWHGWADPHISPLNTIAYYTAMQKLMGEQAVGQFARLYLFPGGYHCGGGEGPFDVDLLTPIMAWVERGSAPNALIATHTPEAPHGMGGPGGPGGPPAGSPGGPDGPPHAGLPRGIGDPVLESGAHPGMIAPKPAAADRTRPVFPYPYTAQYTGKGSIEDAANFVQGPAQPAPADRLGWFGSGFYSAHYETWCTGTGTLSTCQSTR